MCGNCLIVALLGSGAGDQAAPERLKAPPKPRRSFKSLKGKGRRSSNASDLDPMRPCMWRFVSYWLKKRSKEVRSMVTDALRCFNLATLSLSSLRRFFMCYKDLYRPYRAYYSIFSIQYIQYILYYKQKPPSNKHLVAYVPDFQLKAPACGVRHLCVHVITEPSEPIAPAPKLDTGTGCLGKLQNRPKPCKTSSKRLKNSQKPSKTDPKMARAAHPAAGPPRTRPAQSRRGPR